MAVFWILNLGGIRGSNVWSSGADEEG